MPEYWGDLHRLHDAWLSGQIHAVHESTARIITFFEGCDDLRPRDPCAPEVYPGIAEQGAELAGAQGRISVIVISA